MPGESYPPAAGLIERSAAAYVSGVPEHPADDGFFGPASVTWRMSGDLAGPVAGLRSLMMQALHPLAMAGVDQHSGWRQDPVGRLAATSAYVSTVSFGGRPGSGWRTCSTRRASTRTLPRSGRTSETARSRRCRNGRGRCTDTARRL